jgi:hypothetical protein
VATTVWLADALVNSVFPRAREHFGAAACFFGFALLLLPQVFVVIFIMPETKGRTLEDIEQSPIARGV